MLWKGQALRWLREWAPEAFPMAPRLPWFPSKGAMTFLIHPNGEERVFGHGYHRGLVWQPSALGRTGVFALSMRLHPTD